MSISGVRWFDPLRIIGKDDDIDHHLWNGERITYLIQNGIKYRVEWD